MTRNVYEFSTFEEFFERVPADRMVDCLHELAINFYLIKTTMKTMSEINKSLGGGGFKPIFKTPFIWTDDKKGELKANVYFPGKGKDLERVFTIKAKLKAKK